MTPPLFSHLCANLIDLLDYSPDPQKKRYFKIEANKTAPRNAPWSADSVKRRKIESHEADLARKRVEQTKGRVKRARVLAEPLSGGFLLRETGSVLPCLLYTSPSPRDS